MNRKTMVLMLVAIAFGLVAAVRPVTTSVLDQKFVDEVRRHPPAGKARRRPRIQGDTPRKEQRSPVVKEAEGC